MTDKEIIIDGVDVAECELGTDSIGFICNLKNGKTDKCNCSDYPNCYYKQLKRKEQECEELKEQLELNTQNAVVIDMAKRLYSYKQSFDKIEDIATGAYKQKYVDSVGVGKSILNIIKEVKGE